MPGLSPQPAAKLSKLRDIGWKLWDPIGLLGPEEEWDKEVSWPLFLWTSICRRMTEDGCF